MRSISITRVYGSTGSSAAWTWEHPIAGDELRAIKRDIAMRTEALPLALHLRARAAAHAAIRELPLGRYPALSFLRIATISVSPNRDFGVGFPPRRRPHNLRITGDAWAVGYRHC
jgi:hypothetical protein